LAKGVGGLVLGRLVQVQGFWDRHPKYGNQFVIDTCDRSEFPHQRKALVRYLAARVPGLGIRRSEGLVSIVGETVLQKLMIDPDLVKRVFPGGVGERIALGVRQWLSEEKSEKWSMDIAPKLMAAGNISYSQARRIISYFSSADVADLIARRDPYRLLDVPGIGWGRADAIAQSMDVARDADERLEAAVQWSYQEELRKGNSAVQLSHLISSTLRLAGGRRHDIGRAIARCTIYCELVRSKGAIFRPDILQLEWSVADLVNHLLRKRFELNEDIDRKINQVIKSEGLNRAQRQAVLRVLCNGVSIITGGPGTGKTHTLRALAKSALFLGLNFQITAPTGKAVVRAAELCNTQAVTIHKLLGGAPGSLRQGGPIRSGILVLEESSMIDLELMSWLANNINSDRSFRLVFIGDCNQLPSISHGQVLADLLRSGAVTATVLTEVQRQSSRSNIIVQAHRILRRQPLNEEEKVDWRFVELPEDAQKAQNLVMREVKKVAQEEYQSVLRKVKGMPFNPKRDLQVLSPRNTGQLGVIDLNTALRKHLNPSSSVGAWIGGGERVRLGDRVVCTQNDYTIGDRGLMNGEQGVVIMARSDTTTVHLDDGRIIEVRGLQNNNLRLAFCMSIHRSQGSEYPVVIVVFHSSHYPLLDNRLLYTALTRSKVRVVLCADRRALQISISGAISQHDRVTRLASRIISV
jgi:exodeoxyribonuclease V alpha subunit